MDGSSETNDVITDFKKAITEWIEIYDNLQDIQKVLKDKRNRHKKLGEFITAYMTKSNKEMCQIGENDIVVLKKRMTTKSLKKAQVIDVLKDILKDEARAIESTERIFNSREQTETVTLKLTR